MKGACRERRGRWWLVTALTAVLVALAATAQAHQSPPAKRITLIHIADTHAKLAPHWEKFSDGRWHNNSGGFAKLYTKVQEIRAKAGPGRSLLLVTGDNFHGGAELFFTRGRAVVPILNAFGIDAYSPGNWDFADGPTEFRARFTGTPQEPKLVNFPALAAGVYNAEGAPPWAKVGERVLPPYLIKEVDGLKVALIALNDDKPNDQAKVFTIGLDIRAGWDELPPLLKEVRQKGADLVVVMSEAGLAQNLAIARDYPGIDVLFSGDTHEEIHEPIRVKETGTLVVESGEGSRVGEFNLTVVKGAKGARITQYQWKLHEVDENVKEDPTIKKLVDEARAPFLKGPAFKRHVRVYPGWKPGTGLVLSDPIDTVVGHTDTDLERWQLFEGVGDNVIADALRELTGADIGGTNGFRYDVGIPAGQPITLADIYHWLPLGAHVAVGEMTGGQILKRFEQYLSSVLDPNPYRRGGGWVPRVSGVRFYVDLTGPHGPAGKRIVKAEVFNRKTGQWEPLQEDKVYTMASCYTPGDPLDHMCRTSGVRNIRFLTSDLKLVPPLVDHQPPNPQPKVKVAPDNVMSMAELLRKYIETKGGWVRAAEHSDPRWIIVKGQVPVSDLAPNVVQPLQGAGPDWLAAKRVGD